MWSLIFVFALFAQVFSLDNGLARTPPMGWNSWNHFGCNIDEKVIRDSADVLIKSGLAAVGYEYVNIDDCWAVSRDSTGKVVADPKAFPSGIKALADYVHSRGLKFGIYSDAGTQTCAGRPGSYGYEKIDAATYAEWGVDYLKYDNCYAPDVLPHVRYATMRDALNATGRPIVFSMCDWGVESPWVWGSTVGNSWRTTHDISDEYNNFFRVLDNNIGLSSFAGPGGWNDPDMLEVGNGGMSFGEYKSHFAIWCVLKSPLLIGCDLTKMSNETLFILKATELIAANQDPLGVAGDLIYQLGPIQIWATILSDGSRVAVLFNRHSPYDPYPSEITLDFKLLGFSPSTRADIRDLYNQKDLGIFTGSFSASVPTHDCVAIKITPLPGLERNSEWRPWHKNY